MTKAIALLSGGLDSILAIKIILEQNIEVEAINFITTFFKSNSYSTVLKLGIKLKVFDVSKEYLDIVKTPKYGYGSNMNPCIDCKIFMLKKAYQYLKETGAQFLITGEVLGERPMSQTKRALEIIEKESKLEGLILRPLSAKLLKPTIPEKTGLVDRNKLFDIKGRSRKVQIALASKFNIKDYPNPSGGCLLTDPGFSRRMKDLIKHNQNFSLDEVELLKFGRHFRLSPFAKLIVGRDKTENDNLLKFLREDDFCFMPSNTKGPIAIGRGIFSESQTHLAVSIVARYSDKCNDNIKISYCKVPEDYITITANPIDDKLIENLRI